MHNRLINILCLAFFSATYAQAQSPQITGLSTYAAPVNGAVTISGSNFSNTPAENRVFFGTVEAVVQSATSTSLTVIVPPGTTYEPLTVIVNGLMASSARPVTTFFDGSGAIDPTSFETPEVLSASLNIFLERILADIDGDGKLDIVGRKEASRGFLVARNTSDFVTGNISFAEPVLFTIDSYPRDIDVADMDGDGKPEVLILKNSSTATGNFVTVFKNTSVAGVIDASAFTTGPDFATVMDPEILEIADVDLDGKRDVIVSNETSIVAVHQNTSAQGVINTNSFAPLVQYTFPVAVRTMKVADMDGDARPEIVYTGNSDSKAFRIKKNSSTTGVPLTTTSLGPDAAFGTSLESVVMLVDLNRDNKPEVITPQNVYPNTSATGAFSFSAAVDMFPGYGSIFPVINDYDGDGSPDVIHIGEGNAIHSIRIPGTGDMIFQRSINLNVGLVALNVASTDLNGDGRPDLLVKAARTGSPGADIYAVRNRNSPLPDPTITSIAPPMAAPGSVVAIIGTNFGHVYDNNVVLLNGQMLRVLRGTGTSLEVVIPSDASSGYFTVKANNLKEATAAQLLTIIHPPVIQSFEPKIAAAGAHITLLGENFGATAVDNTVFFGAVKAQVIEASPNSLKVSVPYGASYGPISVQVNGLAGKSTDPFTLSYPEGKPLAKHTFRQFSLPANTNVYPSNALKLADIDSDGKTDIVICNTDEQAILIYRNISTAGELSASSFAEAVRIHSPLQNPSNIQVGDLDGDGKPDLAVLTFNSVAVYRNISQPGAIDGNSFEPPFDFIIASFLNDFFLEDMDNDGKLDIIWSRWDPSLDEGPDQSTYPLWIARNISRPGVLNSGTFEGPKHLLIPIATLQNFTIADVNKDHLPDIIGMTSGYTIFHTRRVFIYENKSTPANLQIGSYYSTSTEWETSDIVSGDLNNDGIIDLVGTDAILQKAYIMNSAEQITNIPDATFTRTSLGLTSIRTAISDMDGDGKADLILNDATVKILKNMNTGVLNAGAFAVPLSIPARQHAVYAGDLDGDGLNDLVGITPDSIIVTHNINKPTPVINGFAPDSGIAGTHVFLSGENFGATESSSVVRINGILASVVEWTDSILVITVPPDATTGRISVEVDGMTGISANVFSVVQPQTIAFDSIPPKQFGTDYFVDLPDHTSAGLPIQYTSSDPTVAYVWYGDLRIAGAGTTTITASHPGNSSYAPAAPVKRILQVKKGILEIKFVDYNVGDYVGIFVEPVYEDAGPFYVHPVAFGESDDYPGYVQLPVRITSNNPEVATVADTLVTVHHPGSAFVTFSHDGNKDYEPYSVTHELVVKAYGQAITFDPIDVPCDETGRTIELRASSTSGLPVTFTSTNLAVATVQGNTAIIKANGATDIIAQQSGDQYYPAAEPVTHQLMVDMQTQTITFDEIPVKLSTDESFSIDVSATSGLAVDVVSTNTGVASVSGNVVTIHGPGETDLVASQRGNACFLTADPVARRLTVVLVTSLLETGDAGQVTLFPNPTRGSVRVKSVDNTPFTNVRVIGAVGGLLYDAPLEGVEGWVDLSGFPAGAYIVEVRKNNGVVFRRLLKY